MDAALLAGRPRRDRHRGSSCRALDDALVARLLAWAEADLGPAAGALGLDRARLGGAARADAPHRPGQRARRTRDGGGRATRYWFAGVRGARRTRDLRGGRVPAVRAGHMARLAHAPLSEWTRRFNACIDERRPHAAALLFDFRKVGGALDLSPLEAAMGARAAEPRVPALPRAGRGRAPAADVARAAAPRALAASTSRRRASSRSCSSPAATGSRSARRARATLDRLDAAARGGAPLARTRTRSVAQAYRFLLGLRLRHQLRHARRGAAAPRRIVRLAELVRDRADAASRSRSARSSAGRSAPRTTTGRTSSDGARPTPPPSSAPRRRSARCRRALFEEAARAVDVAFHPAGTWLVRAGGRPLEHLYVIRKGAVRLERDGQTLQVLEEGETFGYTSLIAAQGDASTCRWRRTSSRTGIPDDGVPAAPRRRAVREPLRGRALGAAQGRPRAVAGRDLPARPLARGPADRARAGGVGGRRTRPSARRRGGCARSTRPACSSAADPPGDRDRPRLPQPRPRRGARARTRRSPRSRRPSPRTVARRRPASTRPGRRSSTRASTTCPSCAGGEIVGVLTSTDLLRCSAQGPMAVLRRVERLPSRDEPPRLRRDRRPRWPRRSSPAASTRPSSPASSRGSTTRSLDRIVRLAEADLGPAPAPVGLARARLGGPDGADAPHRPGQRARLRGRRRTRGAAWFGAFAERVNADLEAAGFPRCPGGYMARALERAARRVDAALRRAGSTRRRRRRSSTPRIFFDFRRVAGDARPRAARGGPRRRAVKKPVFLRFLARAALDFHPPPAAPPHAAGRRPPVDLKVARDRAGRVPRPLLRARAGRRASGTPSRGSRRRRGRGSLPEDVFAAVAEAYRFLLGLRLRLQLERLAAGRAAARARCALARARRRSSGASVKDALRAVKRASRTRARSTSGRTSDGSTVFFSSPPWDSVIYWALDLETGGLDAERDPIIAVGHGADPRRARPARRELPDARAARRRSRRIDPASVRAHQLVWGEVKDAPPIAEVLPEVERRLAERRPARPPPRRSTSRS